MDRLSSVLVVKLGHLLDHKSLIRFLRATKKFSQSWYEKVAFNYFLAGREYQLVIDRYPLSPTLTRKEKRVSAIQKFAINLSSDEIKRAVSIILVGPTPVYHRSTGQMVAMKPLEKKQTDDIKTVTPLLQRKVTFLTAQHAFKLGRCVQFLLDSDHRKYNSAIVCNMSAQDILFKAYKLHDAFRVKNHKFRVSHDTVSEDSDPDADEDTYVEYNCACTYICYKATCECGEETFHYDDEIRGTWDETILDNIRPNGVVL